MHVRKSEGLSTQGCYALEEISSDLKKEKQTEFLDKYKLRPNKFSVSIGFKTFLSCCIAFLARQALKRIVMDFFPVSSAC